MLVFVSMGSRYRFWVAWVLFLEIGLFCKLTYSQLGHLLYLLFLKSIFLVNRRLDEWVKVDQLDLDTVEKDVDEKVEDKVGSPLKRCYICSFDYHQEQYPTLSLVENFGIVLKQNFLCLYGRLRA